MRVRSGDGLGGSWAARAEMLPLGVGPGPLRRRAVSIVPAPEPPPGWRTPVVAGACAAYALVAAATSAFTWPADALTALPIAALAVLVVARWPWRPRPRPASSVTGGPHPYRAWAVLLVVAVAWEVSQYLAPGSRGRHPTLSSMADALDHRYLAKALVFFGWLCLGLSIVHRGGRSRPGVPPTGLVDAP